MNSESVMSLIQSTEEARVIETAVRAAVLSVVKVINDINKIRLEDYRRKVAEMDKENGQLKAEVRKAEKELALLRQLVYCQEQDEESVWKNASTANIINMPGNNLNVETSCVENLTMNEAVTAVQSSVVQSNYLSSEPLSAAERQRRYRARRDADPERRAQYLELEKKRKLGKKKPIHECSEKEQRLRRRRWKLAKAKSRASKISTGSLSTLPARPESELPHPEEAGHSIDVQVQCFSEETTAIQDHFDPATGSSNQNGQVSTLSDYSESHTECIAGMNFPVVKQEPPNTNTVYIKLEVKEENVCTDQDESSPSCVRERESSSFIHQSDDAFGTRSRPSYCNSRQVDRRVASVQSPKKRYEGREKSRRYRERIRADPEKQQAYLEKDRHRTVGGIHSSMEDMRNELRTLQETVVAMQQQPSPSTQQFQRVLLELSAQVRCIHRGLGEELQWRVGPHDRYQQRKKLIHELPEQLQKQKRALWREAARRSRARKKAHLSPWTEPL